MSHKKVQQLAIKFAEGSLNEQYQAQRAKLEQFSETFLRKLRAALNELEGDLSTLKHREFDKTQWKELGLFWRTCIELYKKIDEKNPYAGVQSFIDLIKSKSDWLVKIIPSIRKHLKATEVDFGPSKVLRQARADGLKELILLIENSGQYMRKNPLLPDPRNAPTVPPPKMGPIADPEFKEVGPAEVTKVEGLPKQKDKPA
jgi:hypothetical protein